MTVSKIEEKLQVSSFGPGRLRGYFKAIYLMVTSRPTELKESIFGQAVRALFHKQIPQKEEMEVIFFCPTYYYNMTMTHIGGVHVDVT
jgi:hypothetical protein